MAYQVLALKYRPGSFSEVVGQDAVTEVLAGALDQQRIAQAYLFSGPRGCGKTTTARILAKALNCEQGPTSAPCGECDSCQAILRGASLTVVEVDAASNRGIDDIRRIREEAGYASVGGRYKVYIVDEAHQITGEAANAFLKTLEEPPPNVVFVLATTEAQKIIPTIHSRCQHFQFRLLSVKDIGGRLSVIADSEGIDIAAEVIQAIARRAEGSMRDGITLLDQVLASVEGSLTLERVTEILGLTRFDRYYALTEAFLARDAAAAIRELDRILDAGLGARDFAMGLARYFRNLLFLKLDPALLDSEMSGEERQTCQRFADALETDDLLYLARLVGERADKIRFASQPRLLLETLVVELARFESQVLLSEIMARLKSLGGGAPLRRDASRRGSGQGEPRAAHEDGVVREVPAATKPTGRPKAKAPERGAMQPTGPVGNQIAPSAALRPSEPAAATAPARAPAQSDAVAGKASRPAKSGSSANIPAAWGDFIDRVSRDKKSLGSFLEHARPGPLGERHFTLLVQNPFYLSMLDTPANLKILAETFHGTFGEDRQIRLELMHEDETPDASDKVERISQEKADTARRQQSMQDFAGDDLVQDLLQRFDGEVLED